MTLLSANLVPHTRILGANDDINKIEAKLFV